MTSLTPEQLAADALLLEALKACEDAYWNPAGALPRGQGVITDYVVEYAVRGFSESGEDVYTDNLLVNETTPVYAALGLVHTARLELEAQQRNAGYSEDD